MAAKRQLPTVRLRRLSGELRRLRKAHGLSREEVVKRTSINSVTLYRIEAAKVRPQRRTVMSLLDLYEVGEPRRSQTLELLKPSDELGWLRSFHAELPDEYTAYISFEAEARSVRNYESLFVPGLLQTPDYARAVIEGVLWKPSAEEVDLRVRARSERQQAMVKEVPLGVWAIVDEAVLHRQVGGADVMKAQLTHLLDVGERPNITLQVVPFTAGAHPGMPGSLVLMNFPAAEDLPLVYVDSMAGDLFLEAETDIERYEKVFDRVHECALSPDDSAALIAERARELA